MKKPNYLVVKHNNLIEARYSLTLCEQKLVTAIAMMIKPNDLDFREYYLDVRDFTDLMEVTGNSYHTLVEQRATVLMKKPIKIPLNNRDFMVCNWFSSITYLSHTGQVKITFAPELKPYMIQLKEMFTAYRIENIMTMTSVYAIRLYELLKQYLSISHRRFELDDLKLKLEVADKYPNYNQFNVRVLTIAKREINKKSDILIEYHPKKTGRKVTAIEFDIDINPKKKESAGLPMPEEQKIIDKLPTQATPTIQKAVRKAVKMHGDTGAAEILKNVKKHVDAGKVENVAAYVTACFTEGHGVQTPDERTQRHNAEQRQREQERAQVETARKQQLDLQRYEAEQERMKQIMNLIEQLPKTEQDELKGEAEQLILDQNDGKEPPLGFNLYVRLKMMELYPAWHEMA